METIGQLIRRLRIEKGDPLRKVAAYIETDQAVMSKIERGKRKLTKEQVEQLADYFGAGKKEFLIAWLSDKIVSEVLGESYAGESLKVAEEKLQYQLQHGVSMYNIVNAVDKELSRYPQISKAWIFGSYARNDNNYQSDIDLMIEVPARKDFSMFDLFQIQHDLENALDKKVDVVIKGAVKPFVWKSAQPDLKLIYEKSGS
jgi:predicted nucleotidyltransferase